jgi:hypothetical protein
LKIIQNIAATAPATAIYIQLLKTILIDRIIARIILPLTIVCCSEEGEKEEEEEGEGVGDDDGVDVVIFCFFRVNLISLFLTSSITTNFLVNYCLECLKRICSK